MLLAIDTSTAIASVALLGERPGDSRPGILVEHTWRAGQRHTTQLLPRIGEILGEVAVSPESLTAIAVALGPGSFNGLRVGISTAKLLAHSLGIPLVGASTLEVTANGYREAAALASLAARAPIYVRPLDDAGRGQIATALYRSVAPRRNALSADSIWLEEIEPPRLVNLEVLFDAIDPKSGLSEVRNDRDSLAVDSAEDGEDGIVSTTLLCGEIREEWAAAALREGGERLLIASGSSSPRRAGSLAELGWRRLRAGQIADPATLQAIYLRRPPVLERHSLPELG